MSEPGFDPLIDPSSFDLVVVGTGLPQSIVAASASASGKSVLHLDPNPFYGSHSASLSLDPFVQILEGQQSVAPPPSDRAVSTNVEYLSLSIKPHPVYTDTEITSHAAEALQPSRSFSLDLSGPRVLLCADPMVDLMLKCGASHHIEFKSIDLSLIYMDGRLSPVADSREAIFKDRTLGLTEKSQMMRFFKLIQEHFSSNVDDGQERRKILEEDLERPFHEFLMMQRVPAKIRLIILYAIAMADYDQNSSGECKKILRTKDGIDRIALYHASVGRFPNAAGAFLYPIYGQGELPQAFCRCAAVKGTLYVLRMPVRSLLVDKETNHYKGVKLASGQDIFSHQLVLDPSISVAPPVSSSLLDVRHEEYDRSNSAKTNNDEVAKVARGICIIDSSIQTDVSNLLIVFPPRSLHAEQLTSVRAIQLSGNVSVCPPGLFVLYLSTLCGNPVQGKKSLHAAMAALLRFSNSENSESSEPEEHKRGVLWSTTYIQELTQLKVGQLDDVSSCPMPDGTLDHVELLKSTTELYQKIFPEEEFFPENAVNPATMDDDS